MLQFKRENLDGLDESLHALYEQKDGVYFLKVDGAVSEDDVSGLRKNRDELLAEKQEAKRLKDLAEAQKLEADRKAQEELARKNGDFEALENSWKEKLANSEAQYKGELEQYKQRNYELTVGRAAQELAGSLAKPNVQSLMAREIKSRLSLDENGNVRVLDKQGKPSAMSIEELKKDLMNDPEYSDIIIVSHASGGNATGGFGGGAGKKPKEMTAEERAEWAKNDPESFNSAVKQGLFK